MRTIGVVTVGRSDYGIYLPVLREIQAYPDLRLHLIVSGMHLSPEFGLTESGIENDGFEIDDRVLMLLSSDTPEGIAKSMGLGTIGFAQSFARFQPDILLVLGDRFEMHAAALAALPFNLPVAHIHGGEVTEGAMDDALRHSITKLSHLHFVSTEEYRDRVLQLGEEPWRVMISGAPSLDNVSSTVLLSSQELEAKYGLNLKSPPILVTFHPVTLEHEKIEWQVGEMLAALDTLESPVILTQANADTKGRSVDRMIREFVEAHPAAHLLDNLGTTDYFSFMALAAVMIGNSSSGIIEAASFKLPVVNIGTRQKGRVRAANVIDVGYDRQRIIEGMERATNPAFRKGLGDLVNPYGCGGAAIKIVGKLNQVDCDQRLITKRFSQVGPPGRPQSRI